MRKIFIVSVFIFAFSIFASAQQIPPSYGFLEAVDYKDEPVADASVRLLYRAISRESLINQGQLIGETNRQGLLENGIQVRGDSRYGMPFSIDKAGFYPFIDCFGLFDFLGYGWRNNKDKPLKIELLIVPQTRAEKKIVGDEQRKRELFLAIYNGNTESVGRLLKAKINPNVTTADLRGVPISKNLPAVVYAADLADIEAIKELLAAGADVRGKNSPARDVLVNYLRAEPFFLRYPQTEEEKARRTGYENGVETLIEAGANLAAKDKRGYSLLMIAAEQGYRRAVEILLEKGTPAGEKNQKDRALLISVERGHYEAAQVLLKNKANPNFLTGDVGASYDNGCNSPLIAAANNADLKTARLLVENGADVNFTCKNGTSAFSRALERERNFYYDPAQQREIYKIVDLLFDSGLNTKAVDESGATMLMTAVQNGNRAAVERLVKMGADVNAKSKNGSTALMLAASSVNRFDIVKLLIASGANVNAAFEYTNGYEGNSYFFCHTPLTNAATAADITDEPNDLTDVMQLLVSNGANVNFKCSNGETALTMAARVPSVKGVKRLIELGADVKGEQGRLALKYAKERLKDDWKKRAETVVAMLEAAGAK